MGKTEDGHGAIQYLELKEFRRSLKVAHLMGGQHAKKAIRVRAVLGSLAEPDPFVDLPVTNNGETRIPNCVKYDLGSGWRLVTQQTDKTCTFCLMGDHDDVDAWLRDNTGTTIGVKDRQLVRIPGVGAASAPVRRWSGEQHDQPLVEMLDQDEEHVLFEGLSPRLVRALGGLDGHSTPDDLSPLLKQVDDEGRSGLVRAVLSLLMAGDVDGAKAHVGLRNGDVVRVSDLDGAELVEVVDGEGVRTVKVGSKDYEDWLRTFERQGRWQDWFLFLHPGQERVVQADYDGVAQLSGVSGSGKTCVVVRRAIRLAGPEGARVLLLTLNRSLAGLLRQLVDAACFDDAVRARIDVSSFFDLSRSMLLGFENADDRHYDDVSWKLGEHVDEVFREYYRQWLNNRAASVMGPLHRSLNARGVSGELYFREEFDWVRSAVGPDVRGSYLALERKGRKFPIAKERRNDVLAGLAGWEDKMRAVGIVDYLGLTSALYGHLGDIRARYTNVLVDEAQDFGTTELRVVRRLVPPGPNDLFLCGDIAQTVLPKHRSLIEAGLGTPHRERIQQNYRNSREILAAAYDMLKNNLHEEMFDSDDLEILDPRFANFSGSVPMALRADTLEEEIAYARAYAATLLQGHVRTICIAFAGYSARSVKSFARDLGVTALDGAYDPGSDPLVFSDLEQTKGYEFDCLVIVNCRDGVLPARDVPAEEAFRDTCKLYVAMTRARRELVLSFHGTASPWIRSVQGSIGTDGWDQFETIDATAATLRPDVLPEAEAGSGLDSVGRLSGSQFLYTEAALGMSLEAQEKLADLVDGKGLTTAATGRRVRWVSIEALRADLLSSRRHDLLLGPKVSDEVRTALGLMPRQTLALPR